MGTCPGAYVAEHSLGLYPLNFHQIEPSQEVDSLVMGYANLSEPGNSRLPQNRPVCFTHRDRIKRWRIHATFVSVLVRCR